MALGGGAGERPTTVLWGLLTALCVGAAAVGLVLGLARVAPWGHPESVVVTECHTKHAGRNDYVQCEARSAGGALVSLRHDGHPGEAVRAVRAPWGSYVVPQTGVTAWAIALAVPLALLLAASVCGMVTLRRVRRLRYRPNGETSMRLVNIR
ncbi:hypothetical protein [Streptomyces sp. CB01881]|uniref:hypothetical protein n=1 Tax=Streptomyces sp. CB01881 TaxID=2078691 RepID=UPI000CDC35D6|nr:hypothetical protein [Streptomyces sp. CB01881]AUY49432.1 hypothetical protein C2142_11325 [Streptomyces sp. CB01881]TYC72816.1 hypothetical protein EH183_11320 [Streptomyces sp. CB01881]